MNASRPAVPGGKYMAAAIILSLLFLAGHLAGFRAHTALLADPGGAGGARALFGLYYLASWLSFTVLGPILLIAGGMRFIMSLFRGKS